jgi:RpiR family carbohydrate utilization transcriptional regulator
MLDHIAQIADKLSRAEKQVANWILAHPREAAESTIAEVARQCDTSQPTVIRFCRRVGLSGFRELTIRLAESRSRGVSYVHRAVGIDDRPGDAMDKVLESSIQSLNDVRSNLAALPVDEAVGVLNDARQIAFAGLGASGYVARDACHKFFRLGTPSSALTDTPGILQFAAVAQARDVLVIISHSGTWPELARAAIIARDNGATVIAITAPGCRLAQASTIVVGCAPAEDTSVYTPMTSRLAQLALLDAIHVALALSLGNAAVDKLKRSKEVLRNN